MPVSPFQKTVLDRIQAAGDGYLVNLTDKSPPLTRTINSLLAFKFIIQEGERLFITQSGARVLEKLKEPANNIVPPRTHCYINEKYSPDKSTYYRNEGNKHISSRGF